MTHGWNNCEVTGTLPLVTAYIIVPLERHQFCTQPRTTDA